MKSVQRSRSLPKTCPGVLLLVLLAFPVAADEASARASMEDPANPLVVVNTGRGTIFLELFPAEAPQNVTNFLALAEGQVEILDRETGQAFMPRYYDGMSFHRVIPGLLIQAGSPALNVFGPPARHLADEINADSLGLDRMPVVLPDGSFTPVLGIGNRQDLEETLLLPLYRAMNIQDNETVGRRQFEIDQRLRSMTVKQAYQNLGYVFNQRYTSRPITRGVVGLANSGPDTNGPEFFVAVSEAKWLDGRYTVIGRVVEGMNVVDIINQSALDETQGSARGVPIYSVTRP